MRFDQEVPIVELRVNVAQRKMTDASGVGEWLADSYRFPAVDHARETDTLQ